MVPCLRLGISTAFGYILWKVMSTWVGELHMRLMVPCVRLGYSPCFCLHPVVGDEYNVLVICI